MTVTLNLNPDTERALRDKASQCGQTLETYLEGLAARDAQGRNGITPLLVTTDFESRLDDLSEGLSPLPRLPADFSRADIYADRD
jgi:hypothetical protein